MKIIYLVILISLFSCSSKKEEEIILPPDFNMLPDPKKPEITPKNNQKDNKKQNIKELKELLLQSQ